MNPLLGLAPGEACLFAARAVAAALTISGLELPLRRPLEPSAGEPRPTLH